MRSDPPRPPAAACRRARAAAALAAALALAGCVAVIPVPIPLPAGGPGPAPRPASEAGPPPAPPCPAPARAPAERARLLEGLNALRAAEGRAPVAASARLEAAAQRQACDNAARGSIGHVGADGSDLARRLAQVGYRHGIAAENTGRGYADAARALAGWSASAGHRTNLLLAGVREAGLGLATGPDGRPYWVLVLAEPR